MFQINFLRKLSSPFSLLDIIRFLSIQTKLCIWKTLGRNYPTQVFLKPIRAEVLWQWLRPVPILTASQLLSIWLHRSNANATDLLSSASRKWQDISVEDGRRIWPASSGWSLPQHWRWMRHCQACYDAWSPNCQRASNFKWLAIQETWYFEFKTRNKMFVEKHWETRV